MSRKQESARSGAGALGGPERSGGPPSAAPGDGEVLERPRRRQFAREYKLRIVTEADACTEPGGVAALLRREGLYSSHLVEWRKLRREGSLEALGGKRRGPAGRRRDPVAKENERLRREVERLRRRLRQAETILEIQKKASEILGIPLKTQDEGEGD